MICVLTASKTVVLNLGLTSVNNAVEGILSFNIIGPNPSVVFVVPSPFTLITFTHL